MPTPCALQAVRPERSRSPLSLTMQRYTLYDYWRSSAAYRVRIAFHLKGLAFESTPIHLLDEGGHQHRPDYTQLNPQALVPLLHTHETGESPNDGYLSQSLAIIEYLDECHPSPALLPLDPKGRARVRSLALLVACDIHPLNNLRVLQYLEGELGVASEQRQTWVHHWIATGLTALEHHLRDNPATGAFCHGDSPTLADCCLVPQLFNARRFGLDLSPCPTLERIDQHCRSLPAFVQAEPRP